MIESRATRKFWRCFESLPPEVREEAIQAYRLFREHPFHRSLQFKKLRGEDEIYSVRIGLHYRALAAVKNHRAVWYWIGSHADYDQLV